MIAPLFGDGLEPRTEVIGIDEHDLLLRRTARTVGLCTVPARFEPRLVQRFLELDRATLPVDTIASFVGEGARQLCARAIHADEHDPAVEPVLAAYLAHYERHPSTHAAWMPHAVEALDALAPWPLAVCTNKPGGIARALLAALGPLDRFACVIGAGDSPARKPSAEPLLAVARHLGLPPASLWLVGDSPIDIATARAAGATAVAVPGGFSALELLQGSAPDLLLATLADLPPLVRRHA